MLQSMNSIAVFLLTWSIDLFDILHCLVVFKCLCFSF